MASNSLHRAAADECLRTVFESAYGRLTMDESTLLINDLIALDTDERVHDLYKSAGILRARIGGLDNLAGYVTCLVAGSGR